MCAIELDLLRYSAGLARKSLPNGGWSKVLMMEAANIFERCRLHLTVIARGPLIRSPGEILSRNSFARLVAELRARRSDFGGVSGGVRVGTATL